MQLNAEQAELQLLVQQEPIPTTAKEFKDHLIYILGKDIKSDQGVNPINKKAVAGTFKDEIVYYKRAIEDLKTRNQWRKLMRDIPYKDPTDSVNVVGPEGEEEVGKGGGDSIGLDPTRAGVGTGARAGSGAGANLDIKSDHGGKSSSGSSAQGNDGNSDGGRGSSSGSNREYGGDGKEEDDIEILTDLKGTGGSEEGKGRRGDFITPFKVLVRKKGDGEIRLELYGYWQTMIYEVAPVKNGVIPVNQHGNVEVWDGNEALIPKGARLLTSRHAMKAAQSLGLPCAPAIFGFENKGSYTAPQIGGAVVLSEHYELLYEAVGNIREDKEEKSATAWETKIVKRWSDLVKKVLTRQRLKKEYGH